MKRSKRGAAQAKGATDSGRRSPLAAGNQTASDDPCPCGTGKSYGHCCGVLHDGERHAATCEQLMRARYSAHVVGDERFLLDTWDPSTRPTSIGFDPAVRWIGLQILDATDGNLLDTSGTIDFIATYERTDGTTTERHDHQEHSRFVRNDKRWAYLTGT